MPIKISFMILFVNGEPLGNERVNPFTPKGIPIDKLNHLALDRVKSRSVMSAPIAVKALIGTF